MSAQIEGDVLKALGQKLMLRQTGQQIGFLCDIASSASISAGANKT